jgi:glycosyltransferase involved in cell wall biosynthesis
MRIAFMNYWFSEGMGYSENLLPAAIARLGHDAHLITSEAQIYYNTPTYSQTYEPFLGPPLLSCGTKRIGNVTVHRIRRLSLGPLHGVRGLVSKLNELRPDVVQGFEVFDLMAIQAAMVRPALGYRLFLESHVHRSVVTDQSRRGFRMRTAAWMFGKTIGKLIGSISDRCYAISSDAAEIAHKYFGISPEKLEICSLGVDTTAFVPISKNGSGLGIRAETRNALGFSADDVVCIYTGRFSKDKGPLILANAIANLRARGMPFTGLFVGDGEQAAQIRACPGCVVHAFVPARELPKFYWASDIGVWPKQESTSQLDAAACGLPVIIGDRAEVRDRIEGNGAIYREDDAEDLARVIETMANSDVRRRLGEHGAKKMRESYSWDAIAARRIRDYEASLVRAR